jgi:hypothetical protein
MSHFVTALVAINCFLTNYPLKYELLEISPMLKVLFQFVFKHATAKVSGIRHLPKSVFYY